MRFLSRLRSQQFFSMSASEALRILVLGTHGDPSLVPLKSLPAGAEIVGMGADVSGFSDDVLKHANCVFCTVTGKCASTLPQIYPQLPALKWVHSQLAGIDTLLFPAFIEDSKVVLTNAKGVYTRSLVEYVIFALLYFAKDLPKLRRNQMARKWDPFFVNEIHGQTLGVVGYGEIGQACAKKAKESFGMKVLASRRRPSISDSEGIAERIYGSDQVNEMIAECDYVLCTAPLTPQTKYLFNSDAFKAMKPSAVFVNIGRGPVCEESALVEALKNKQIRGAALDVFEQEPLSTDSELWSFDNLLFSPHNADLTESCRKEATEAFVDLIGKRLAGEPIDDHVCDRKAGY